MARTTNLNPLRMLINWAKRLVLESVARELADEASDATGFAIEPMPIEADLPQIEYSE
jgi:hypothetical protein